MKRTILLLTIVSHFTFGQNNSPQYNSTTKTTTQSTGVSPKAKGWSLTDTITPKSPVFKFETPRVKFKNLLVADDTSDFEKVLVIKGDSLFQASKSLIGGGGSTTIDTTKVGRIEQGRGTAPIFMYFNGTAWVRNDTSYAPKSVLLAYIPLVGSSNISGSLYFSASGKYIGRDGLSSIRFNDNQIYSNVEDVDNQAYVSPSVGSGNADVSLFARDKNDFSRSRSLVFQTGGKFVATGGYIKGDSVYRDNDSLRYVQLKDAQERFASGDSTMPEGTILIGNASDKAQTVVPSGDVTMDNLGVFTIANNAVTTAKIADANVTNAKLANSTISGVSLGSNLNNLTAGFGVLLNSGTTYNGSSAKTILADTTSMAKRIIDLYIIAGQSNAQGNGSNPSSGSPTNDISYAIQYYNKTLSVCNDPVGNAANASAWPAFAQSYYKLTGRAICVVPTAVGGTAQTCAADVGNGNWDTCGVLVDSSIVKTNRAIVALRALGWTVNVKGVLWAQGEADAGAINSATITQANYIAAFTKMRRRFRTSFGKIPFYIFQTGTRIIDSDVGYESIRQAQVNATRIDSLSKVVFYGAITYQRRGMLVDNVHYNNLGYNEMGRTGAENIVGAFKTVQSMGDRKNLFNNSGYMNYTNLGFNTSKVATTLHLNRTITDTVPTSAYDATTDPILISGGSFQQMIGYVASSSLGARFIIKGNAASGTVLSPTLVATGRSTMTLIGAGFDGADFLSSGRINFITSGTPSSGSVPMDVTIATGTTSSPSERLRVTSDGNVGIGTASPASKLHVEATSATSTRENIARYSVTDASTDFGFINNATSGDNAFALGFGAIRNTSNSTPMQFSGFTTSGNDNGSSPLLQFYCGITSSSTDPANGTITPIATRPIMALNNQANRLVTVLAGGGVGIGTATPATKLDVYAGSLGGTAGNTVAISQLGMPTTNVMQLNTTGVRMTSGSDWRTSAIRQQLTVDASNGMGYIQFEGFAASDNVGGISFGTVNSGATAPFSVPEQMRITNIGNVGIGVVTPTAFLHLKAGTTSYAPFRITGGVAPTSPNTFDIWSETTNNRLMFRQNAASVEVLGASAVNSVSPTSPNRTITIVINGTTYYLHAKTTND